MNKFLRNLALLAMIVSLSSGCIALAGAAAGTGGYMYTRSQEEIVVAVSVNRANEVARGVYESMGLPIVSHRVDNRSARVESKYPEGERTWVTSEYLGENSTKMSIHVGVGGNKKRVDQLVARIKESI